MKQMLIMTDKQVYNIISFAFLFGEYLSWSLAFNSLFLLTEIESLSLAFTALDETRVNVLFRAYIDTQRDAATHTATDIDTHTYTHAHTHT